MKLKSVFVDTSALLGLFKPGDFLRNVCKEILRELVEVYNADLITTNWVQYETLSELKKFGIEYCIRFNGLIKKKRLKVYRIDRKFERKGLETFWRYKDKSWGIVDCTSVEFMRANNIFYVFTNDNDFSQAGMIKLIALDESKNPIKNYDYLTFF